MPKGFKRRICDTNSSLHEEFYSNDAIPHLSRSYQKYLKGDLTIPHYILIWIKNHQNEPIYAGEVIHHIDGNHQNNDVSNLEKVTQSAHCKLEITRERIKKSKQPRKIKKIKNVDGASRSYIQYINGNRDQLPIHILVWLQHNPDDIIYYGEDIVHLNKDYSDNRIENLVKLSYNNEKYYNNKSQNTPK